MSRPQSDSRPPSKMSYNDIMNHLEYGEVNHTHRYQEMITFYDDDGNYIGSIKKPMQDSHNHTHEMPGTIYHGHHVHDWNNPDSYELYV